MKANIHSVLLFVSLFLLSFSAHAHSPMFPDTFKYDDSNEGISPVSKKLIQSKNSTAQRVATPCVDGLAGDYPCRNIDLQSFLAPSDLGGGSAGLNDIWGWTDITTGNEIAIVGRENGTSFVDITDSENPVFIGFLPSHDGGSDSWRDIKIYQDHAFIVADGSNNNTHGLQVYDLTQLANVTPGATLEETAHLGGFGAAHNIAINEDTGFAYVTGAPPTCSGGLFMVDITAPASPEFVGCFSVDGYTHDAQCVTYQGPDADYFGNEICVAYNEDTVTIADVTDKQNPIQISRTGYQGSQYTHQGWFVSDNHSYLLMNDELDERDDNINTTTHIFDVRDLEAPVKLSSYVGPTTAIDHNLYTRNGLVYQSNYRSGLRILSSDDADTGSLQERAYFDTIPCSASAQFSGVWSSYVYFASGNIAVSDIGTGLFIVRPDDTAITSNANNVATVTSPACNTGTGGNTGSNTGANTGGNTGGNIGNTSGGSTGGGGGVLPLWQLLGLGLCILLGARRFYR